MDSNGPHINDQTAVDGNSRKDLVSDDRTDGEGAAVTEENNKLLNDDDDLLSPQAATNQKRNGGLLKKSGHKFVAVIKSLQCSPRVEGDYARLKKEQHKKPQKSSNEKVPSHGVREENDNPQPMFKANFDDFEPQMHPSAPVETSSVSKNLKQQKVSARFDSIEFERSSHSVSQNNNLGIFTDKIDETNDTNDFDTTENDRESDVIQELLNLSGRPPQQPQHQIDPIKVSSSVFPLSKWEEPITPTRTPIQQNFSHYSNDSNDTPPTCNRSLTMTPKNERIDTSAETSTEDDLYAKPPKELFHHSLALGDSLTPIEDESPGGVNSMKASPCKAFQNENTSNSVMSNKLDALNLPVMDSTRTRTDTPESTRLHNVHNVLYRVEPLEKGFSASPAAPSPSPPQEHDSPNSSTVSSFVFSTDGPEHFKANRQTPVSPSFFWKTHPKIPQVKEIPQPQPQLTTTEPISPAFFWKTHPRVTTKSYNFQNRKSIVRKVSTTFKGAGRHQIAEVAIS